MILQRDFIKKKDTRDFASMAATTKEARINLRLSDEVLTILS